MCECVWRCVREKTAFAPLPCPPLTFRPLDFVFHTICAGGDHHILYKEAEVEDYFYFSYKRMVCCLHHCCGVVSYKVLALWLQQLMRNAVSSTVTRLYFKCPKITNYFFQPHLPQ